MNWQSKKIFSEAKEAIHDEGVFTPDQIELLAMLIDKIALAIDKEMDCNKPNYNL